MDLEFLPGQHDVAVMVPPLPEKCQVDDVRTDFQYDRTWHLARFHVTTPSLPFPPIDLTNGESWVEKFDPAEGEWLRGPLHALEDLGPVPYGYVKYRTPFTWNGEPKMFITTRADDAKKVFINGKFVAEASSRETFLDLPLSKYAHTGENVAEISYELFGAPNGGEHLGELKGLESTGIGADFASAKALATWQIQRYAAVMRGREIDPGAEAPAVEGKHHKSTSPSEATDRIWTPAGFLASGATQAMVPAFTWCRARFTLPQADGSWTVPWKLSFDADCDALIYLNGKFVGRFVTIGPQTEFYLPDPYLSATGENRLMFVLAYTEQPTHLRQLRVAPYAEYSARRTRIEFEW